MRSIHFLCGLFRAGSTLLGQILSQNPGLHSPGTSDVSKDVDALLTARSGRATAQGRAVVMPEEFYSRTVSALRGLVMGHYSDVASDKVVIDKHRLWGWLNLEAAAMFPEAKFIACVRRPVDVLASMERKFREQPFLYNDRPVAGQPGVPSMATTEQRLAANLDQNGKLSLPIAILKDMLQCGTPTHVVRYEDLCADPDGTMRRLYAAIGEPYFAHDFANIPTHPVETGWDGLFFHHYPHTVRTKIEPLDRDRWRDVLTPTLAQMIAGDARLDWYRSTFGYESAEPSAAQQQAHRAAAMARPAPPPQVQQAPMDYHLQALHAQAGGDGHPPQQVSQLQHDLQRMPSAAEIAAQERQAMGNSLQMGQRWMPPALAQAWRQQRGM